MGLFVPSALGSWVKACSTSVSNLSGLDTVVHERARAICKPLPSQGEQPHSRVRNRRSCAVSNNIARHRNGLRRWGSRGRSRSHNLGAERTCRGCDEQNKRKRRLHYICQNVVKQPRASFPAGLGNIMMYLRGMSNSYSKPFDTDRCLNAYLPGGRS